MAQGGRHKGGTKGLPELTFAEQAKSFNATMAYVRRVVNAHVRKAIEDGKDPVATRVKCIKQTQRLLSHLLDDLVNKSQRP